MRIHPIFIMTAPVAILITCLHYSARAREPEQILLSDPVDTNAIAGRMLFLKNCAQCHGADARGDEGPDLHALDWSDRQIAARIRNGKAGQMTAFAGKLSPARIDLLVAYVRALK